MCTGVANSLRFNHQDCLIDNYMLIVLNVLFSVSCLYTDLLVYLWIRDFDEKW